MDIPAIDPKVGNIVRDLVFLFMQRPITEEIALKIGEIDGFKNLEIVDGNWVGFDQDTYMTGENHGWIETKLLLTLGNFVVPRNLGRLYPGDINFVLEGTKDSIIERRQPDVAFVKKDRVQKTTGYFYGAPDLAVEIVSPTQGRSESVRKSLVYFEYGTQEVWLVFPKKQEIEVHTSDAVPIVYGVEDNLTSALLPGFELAVATIFEE